MLEDFVDNLNEIFSGLPELVKDEKGRIYFKTIIVYLYHVLQTDMQKELIADILGLTLKKLASYIRKIQKEDESAPQPEEKN